MDISTDVLEEWVSEERHMDLDKEEYIRMEDSKVEHFRDVADDGKYKKKINSLR